MYGCSHCFNSVFCFTVANNVGVHDSTAHSVDMSSPIHPTHYSINPLTFALVTEKWKIHILAQWDNRSNQDIIKMSHNKIDMSRYLTKCVLF